MNMNFIAFSSPAKLRDWPHLDAAAAGHRLLDAGVRPRREHRVHVVLDTIYQTDALDKPPAAGDWRRTPIAGLGGEACALERRDAPARIGPQLGREGVQGLERALDRGAVGGG